MKGFKRFISIFLVTVMAVSLLSACGKSADNNGSATKQSATSSVKSSRKESCLYYDYAVCHNFSDVERFLSEIM